jgi:hypothetical protein
METITFNKFKTLTYHKKIKYIYTKTDENGKILKTVEKETDKFYINKDNKYKIYSAKGFNFSIEGDFFKESDNVFIYSSPYGLTKFEVLN